MRISRCLPSAATTLEVFTDENDPAGLEPLREARYEALRAGRRAADFKAAPRPPKALKYGVRTYTRSYRIRIYPNGAQRRLRDRWFGAYRWLWNTALEIQTEACQQCSLSLTGTDISR